MKEGCESWNLSHNFDQMLPSLMQLFQSIHQIWCDWNIIYNLMTYFKLVLVSIKCTWSYHFVQHCSYICFYHLFIMLGQCMLLNSHGTHACKNTASGCSHALTNFVSFIFIVLYIVFSGRGNRSIWKKRALTQGEHAPHRKTWPGIESGQILEAERHMC